MPKQKCGAPWYRCSGPVLYWANGGNHHCHHDHVIITVIILYWAASGNNFFGYCDHPSSLSFITVITEIIIIIIMSLHSFGDFAKLNRHGKVKVLTFQVHLKLLL